MILKIKRWLVDTFRGPKGDTGAPGKIVGTEDIFRAVRLYMEGEIARREAKWVSPSKETLRRLVEGIADSWERAGTGTFRVKRTEFTDASPKEVSEAEKALDALAGGLGQYNPVCDTPGCDRKTPHKHFYRPGDLAGTIDLKALREEREKPLTIPAFLVRMTLPTDSAARKEIPIFRGVLRYFPAALAGVAAISKLGNDKHNPGEEMHHARGKSADHGDCILRHLIDVEDLIAAGASPEAILHEVNQMAWRALAFAQVAHEKYNPIPQAPGAK